MACRSFATHTLRGSSWREVRFNEPGNDKHISILHELAFLFHAAFPLADILSVFWVSRSSRKSRVRSAHHAPPAALFMTNSFPDLSSMCQLSALRTEIIVILHMPSHCNNAHPEFGGIFFGFLVGQQVSVEASCRQVDQWHTIQQSAHDRQFHFAGIRLRVNSSNSSIGVILQAGATCFSHVDCDVVRVGLAQFCVNSFDIVARSIFDAIFWIHQYAAILV